MRAVLVLLVLTGCNYMMYAPCTDGPWRTEVWVDDAKTGRVEATLRETCNGFPDVETEYQVVGQRPNGTPVTLFAGSIEKWDLRHAVRPREDGTTDIEVWDRRCSPDGAHFTCKPIMPGP